jgi:hypothetical protein
MKLFQLKKYRYTSKAISLAIAISFVGSMLFVQTAKADFSSTFGNVFQTINDTLKSTEEVVIEPELPMKDWVLNRIAEAGLNPAEAEAIIKCESVWNDDAMGFNQNHTADLGLWQINSIHKDISNADKLDYKKATDWAIQKRQKDGSWRAWSCSRKLAFLNLKK